MSFNKQQKKIIAQFGTIILAFFIISVSYSYILPRTEIEIDTVYHSSYSGLFVQSRISNMGTEEITDLKIKISVWNGTKMLETDTHYPGVLNAKQSVKLEALMFDGPHADEYDLIITLDFNQEDGKQNIIYNYKIADYGNLAWHDQYFSF